MPLIVETILTTRNRAGETHIAPLGLIGEGPHWVIAPFKPSRTLDNLRENPVAVASHVDDVRVFAGCLTGRKVWPTRAADLVDGAVLEAAVSHWEMEVAQVAEDDTRPRFSCRLVAERAHRAWAGHNRAQAAVIEAAVLVSRLHVLPREKVEAELAYLAIAIAKTAGPREAEAWGWLMEKVDLWRKGA
ncbi:MAG: DUF447 family protein [Hyphomicrobiaceae bacterium]|nr:DUF447 family protein [Hyphomicrobiaceae bacterium]